MRSHLKLRLGEVGLGQIRVAGQDIRLHLRQALQRLVAEAEMVFHDLLWSQAEPLRDGNVVVNRGLENLCDVLVSKIAQTWSQATAIELNLTDIYQILVAGILEIMRTGVGDVSDVTRPEIIRLAGFGGYEDGQTALAADDVVPLVAGGVPVQLPHCSGLDGEEGGGEVARDGEGLGVDDFERAAGDFVGCLLAEVVAVGS